MESAMEAAYWILVHAYSKLINCCDMEFGKLTCKRYNNPYITLGLKKY